LKWHGYLEQSDFWVFFSILGVSICGILMVFSTTYLDPSTSTFFWKQTLWVLLGICWLIVITGFDYHIWLNYAWWLYGLNIILLILVMFIGRSGGGAVRWLGFGGFQFQPSELSKIILILTLARYLTDVGDVLDNWKKTLGGFLLIGIPMAMIMKQPDLGTSLTLIPVLFAMLYISGSKVKYLVWSVISGIVFAIIAYPFLKEYQKKRILIFLNPEIDKLGAGYNVHQSIIAVGSGKVFGKGWLRGSQSQLDFLPANHTDFAFSSFAEQFGFIGALILLSFFIVIIYRMTTIWTRNAKDPQGILIIIGCAALIIGHLFINMGMTIGIMPVTGLPLPFFSYGGSSYLTFMTAIGLAMNVHQRRYSY